MMYSFKTFVLVLAIVIGPIQSAFDSAKSHKHVASTTFEGVWVKRMLLDAENAAQYPLGNAVAVRGNNKELWFFYAFKPDDGPMIQKFESRIEGARVRITYDPACFYILSIQDLNPPGVTPSPTPTPSSSPVASPTPSGAKTSPSRTPTRKPIRRLRKY